MAKQLPFRLILGSGSAGRRDLLAAAGYTFTVSPSHIDEPTEPPTDVRSLVQHIAWLKAAAVAPRFDDALILSADTVGWAAGQVIGKPNDRADAKRILTLLAGTVHELWTGVCLWHRPTNRQIAWQERSLVQFQGMQDAELEQYLDTRQWEGCSGAYAVQGPKDPYVQVIEGSISNVVGLPMETLREVLAGASALFLAAPSHG